MKKYIKSNSEVSISDLRKLIEYAYIAPLCIMSANRPEYTIEENIERDKLLEAIIASSYDYVITSGAWENPDGSYGDEPSFIVIGPEYTKNRTDGFIKFCQRMCAEFGQDAVLYISSTEDASKLSNEILKNRYDAYAAFYDPDFIEEKDKYYDENSYANYEDDKEISNLLRNSSAKPVFQLHGEYKDRNWNTIQEYNNIIPDQIGRYFTKLARMNGASKFSLMASTILLKAKIPFVTQQSVMKYRHDIYASKDGTALERYNSDPIIKKRQLDADKKLYDKILGRI